MAKPKSGNRQKNSLSKQVKLPSDPQLAAIREQQILPAIKHLLSPDLKIRSSAVQSVVNLIKDTKTRKLLLKEQIVNLLFERILADPDLETRTYGWGILRDLAQEEEADFCIHLYRQNILVGIEVVIKMIIQTIESPDPQVSKLPQGQQDLLWNLTTSVINLSTSLSECQEEILEAMSKISILLNFLFGLLSLDSTPPQLQNEVLLCLISLTEDNEVISQKIVESRDWFQTLIKIKDSNQRDAISSCGVLHNIFDSLQWFDYNTPIEGVTDAILIPVLVKFMEQSSSNGAYDHMQPGHDKFLQLSMEIIGSISTSLLEALEHRKLGKEEFSGFDDVEPVHCDVEMEADKSSDEMSDDDIDADMEMVTGDGSDKDEPPSEELTLGLLVRVATPMILRIFRSKRDAADPIIEYALAAMNNIAWTISGIDFSSAHLSSLQKVWTSLAQETWDDIIGPVLESNTADIELASLITSLSWAVALSVKGEIKLLPKQQRKFMALYQASKDLQQSAPKTSSKPKKETDEFKGLGVKCIGVLGCLARETASIERNREIGNFLATVISLPDPSSADFVEALNQIFDIYSDGCYPYDKPVFWGNNIYGILKDVQPKAKKITKAIDKRKFPELRARADEAVFNLERFLVYKKKESASKDHDNREKTSSSTMEL